MIYSLAIFLCTCLYERIAVWAIFLLLHAQSQGSIKTNRVTVSPHRRVAPSAAQQLTAAGRTSIPLLVYSSPRGGTPRSGRPGPSLHKICYTCVKSPEPLHGYPLLVLLDVYGSLYWAPSFTQDFDSFLDLHPSLPEGETIVEVLPPFTWPHNVGSAYGIRLYAAVTDPESRILIGHWDMAEFGWE